MKFNIDSYPHKRTVMCCKTTEESEFFRRYLDSQGRTWCSGTSYLTWAPRLWTQIGYLFNVGEYSSMRFYTENDYTILNFSDFEWDGYDVVPEKPVKLRFTW